MEQADVAPLDVDLLRWKKWLDNIRRGEILAKLTLVLELLLVSTDVITALLQVDNRFHYSGYLLMYLVLIGINLLFLVAVHFVKEKKNLTAARLRWMERGFLVYLTLIMSWGSVVSLMDQKLYGVPMVFMVMMIIPSVLFFLTKKEMAVPFGVSILIIALGLPFFQPSQDILIGHYVNLLIFIIIAWTASRITYRNFMMDFHANLQLETSKTQLEHEIEENRKINQQLLTANQQLKNMALFDELTGVPNRRGFRNYVDIIFEKNDTHPRLAVLLIDIDNFKQYNDHFGHDMGDEVLVKISGMIDSISKANEMFFCRWGGDEFVVSLLNAAEEGARTLADTIRNLVKALEVPREMNQVEEYLSVSIGIGVVVADGKRDVTRVMRLADSALFTAKNNGRDRVSCNVDGKAAAKA